MIKLWNEKNQIWKKWNGFWTYRYLEFNYYSPPGIHRIKLFFMPIVKVIEVIASSDKSFDDAIKSAVSEVSKTIKNIDSVYVKDFKVHVKDDQVSSYGVICKVSFRVTDK